MGKHHAQPRQTAETAQIISAGFWGSRKAIALRVLLMIIWLVLLAFGGMAQGKISAVAKSDPSFFLPQTAESTLASQEAGQFRSDEGLPALVVIAKKSGEAFDRQDMGELGKMSQELPELDVASGKTLADVLRGPIPVIPNEDATAILIPLNLENNIVNERTADNGKLLQQTVATIRTHILDTYGQQTAGGIDVYVTGPAGLASDLGGAFAGIDVTLLLVAVALVFIILIVVYRSLLIPVAVLATAIAALCGAVLVVYNLAQAELLDLNGQTQGILAILVIGAATDYCLLLIARYREELAVIDRPVLAMKNAISGSWEPIVASGGTVIVGLLTLLISDLTSTASLGPIASLGIVFAMLASLTLLPALLLIPGSYARVMFWPAKIPHYASRAQAEDHGLWNRVGHFVSRKYRMVWVGTLVVLLVFSGFAFTFKASGTSTIAQFTNPTQAVTGIELLEDKFSSGSVQPTTVLIDSEKLESVTAAVTKISGVAAVQPYSKPVGKPEGKPGAAPAGPPPGVADGKPAGKPGAAPAGPPPGVADGKSEGKPGTQPAGKPEPAPAPEPLVVDGRILLNVTTTMGSEDEAAQQVVRDIRSAVEPLNAHALVGGPAAQAWDTQETAQHDFQKIVPVVLIVIAVLLMLLLRAIVAPLLVVIANVISFGATLGICALLFNHVVDFPGADASVPLYAFVFLIALGIDYTIFLMSRAREESLKAGTHRGITQAIGVTGGVITSAGIVLAATFAALGVVPLLFMLQLAIIVALGIIIDTFIVRSLLIPGLVYDVGKRVWWPWTAQKMPADAN